MNGEYPKDGEKFAHRDIDRYDILMKTKMAIGWLILLKKSAEIGEQKIPYSHLLDGGIRQITELHGELERYRMSDPHGDIPF